MKKKRLGLDVFEHEHMGIFDPNPAFDAARFEANAEVLALLGKYLYTNRTVRFGQALRNLDIIREHRTADPAAAPDWVNEFNTEPQEMLKRIKAALRNSP